MQSLKKASEKVFGPGQWKVKLITFVGGTCGSVNIGAFNKNLKELKVLGHMHNSIRKGLRLRLVHELLNAQDKSLVPLLRAEMDSRTF